MNYGVKLGWRSAAFPDTSPGRLARQRGASLLEVLISVLILGIGMLGVAALQATALRNSQSSLEQSQAVIQTYAILDAMRVNREEAISGSYNLALASGCDVPAAGATLAEADLRRWIQELKSSLGSSACGGVACIVGADCTITVRWDDSRATDTGADGVISGQVERETVTRTRI